MKTELLSRSRRSFLRTGSMMAATLAVAPLAFGQESKPKSNQSPGRKPAIADDLVNQIVKNAHGRFDEVERLLKEEPRLVNATWDWGNGDYETALGAASHMGRKDIAELLINLGARKDMFYFAMEGNLGVLRAAINGDQGIVTVPGPHTLTLLYHAAISGNVDLTMYLKVNGGTVDDGALNASVLYGKSYEMTEWLLDNGASYHGQTGFGKKPLAEVARDRGLNQMGDLLDKRLSSSSY